MVRNKGGFTLIEFIVVITILAILTVVAVPTFNAIKQSSEEAACLAVRKNIEKAEQIYNAMNNYQHSREYLEGDFITAESELIVAGYMDAEHAVCPITGETLRWIEVDGKRLVHCPVHGSD